MPSMASGILRIPGIRSQTAGTSWACATTPRRTGRRRPAARGAAAAATAAAAFASFLDMQMRRPRHFRFAYGLPIKKKQKLTLNPNRCRDIFRALLPFPFRVLRQKKCSFLPHDAIKRRPSKNVSEKEADSYQLFCAKCSWPCKFVDKISKKLRSLWSSNDVPVLLRIFNRIRWGGGGVGGGGGGGGGG